MGVLQMHEMCSLIYKMKNKMEVVDRSTYSGIRLTRSDNLKLLFCKRQTAPVFNKDRLLHAAEDACFRQWHTYGKSWIGC